MLEGREYGVFPKKFVVLGIDLTSSLPVRGVAHEVSHDSSFYMLPRFGALMDTSSPVAVVAVVPGVSTVSIG